MPTGNLPAEGAKLHKKVYDERLQACKDKGGDEATCKESAAKQAWGAVENAGWKKDANGNWHKSANLSEFSLRIERASFDKATQERRWRAVASDTDEDSFGDSMSLALFNDFLGRIERGDLVPEDFRSDFWSGGVPYLSVSHYLDLNGKAVPGPTDAVYVDGRCLKAKGRFSDTPLGRACFDAVCRDLYDEKSKAREDKVRISIAFLDWAHKHKSNGFTFERKSLEDTCPECMREFLDHITNGTEILGKEFLKGHLIHLALTRVPVNKRTSMEVDRSMTTRKEDAASIIGEELADEIDETDKALVGKSEALIIKAEDEIQISDAPIVEEADQITPDMEGCPEGMTEEDCKKHIKDHQDQMQKEAELEEKATKKEGDCSHPSSHYLVVEDASEPSKWHLRVKGCDGKPDHRLMGAAWAALHGGYRGNKYSGPNKAAAIKKLTSMYNSENIPTPKAELEDVDLRSLIREVAMEMKSEETEPVEAHPLDTMFDEFKAAYDEVAKSDATTEDKLKALQEPFNGLVSFIRESLKPVQTEAQVTETAQVDMVKALSAAMQEVMQPVAQKLDLVITQLSTQRPAPQQPQVPQRRSIQPQPYIPNVVPSGQSKSTTPHLRELIERYTK